MRAIGIALGLLCVAGFEMLGAEPAPAVTTQATQFQRVVLVRLKNGTDLLAGLQQAVAREKIKNAVILSGFGSLTSFHTHVVANSTIPAKNVFMKEQAPYDLLGVTGAVLAGTVHAHVTVASQQKTTGGHLEPGSSVFTFVFVTLGVIGDDLDIHRYDDQTWR